MNIFTIIWLPLLETILLQFLCALQTQKFRGEANNISTLIFNSWFKLHKAGKLYIICISAREQAGKKTPTTPAEAPAGEYMQQYLFPARPLPNLLNVNIYDWAIFSQYSTIHSARSYYFPFCLLCCVRHAIFSLFIVVYSHLHIHTSFACMTWLKGAMQKYSIYQYVNDDFLESFLHVRNRQIVNKYQFQSQI